MQQLEKMMSGHYLGEIVRRTLLDVQSCFGKDKLPLCKEFEEREFFSTMCMARVQAAKSSGEIAAVLQEELKLSSSAVAESLPDPVILQEVCTAVAKRSSQLGALFIFALLKEMDRPAGDSITAAVDGTVYKKYPGYQAWLNSNLKQLVDRTGKNWKVKVVPALEEGSGIGAAATVAAI